MGIRSTVFVASLLCCCAAEALAIPVPITEIAAKFNKAPVCDKVYKKSPAVEVMVEFGIASWYYCPIKPEQVNDKQFGVRDAIYPIAHKTLPFGTLVKIINPANGKKILGRVVDRGPFVSGRIIDLDKYGAEALGISGIGKVVTKIFKVDPEKTSKTS